MDRTPLILLLALAVTLPLAGCTGGVVLPKTLDISIEYAEGDAQSAQVDGADYQVRITDPNGTIVFEDEGVIQEGLSASHTIVFEEVGPYTLEVRVGHPEHGTKTFKASWDFQIICRTVDHMTVHAVYQGGDLAVETTGGGPFCQVPAF